MSSPSTAIGVGEKNVVVCAVEIDSSRNTATGTDRLDRVAWLLDEKSSFSAILYRDDDLNSYLVEVLPALELTLDELKQAMTNAHLSDGPLTRGFQDNFCPELIVQPIDGALVKEKACAAFALKPPINATT